MVVGVPTTRKHLAQQDVIAVAAVNRHPLIVCREFLKFAHLLPIDVDEVHLLKRRCDGCFAMIIEYALAYFQTMSSFTSDQ